MGRLLTNGPCTPLAAAAVQVPAEDIETTFVLKVICDGADISVCVNIRFAGKCLPVAQQCRHAAHD
jgi:hypothetical protein